MSSESAQQPPAVPPSDPVSRGVGRRSALRLGAGGLLLAGAGAAGVGLLGGRGHRASPASDGGRSGRPTAPASPWSEQFQPGHAWTAGGAGTASADLHDSAVFSRGTQSVRVTTNATGQQSYVRRLGMPALDLTAKMLRVVLRVEDTTHLARLTLYVGANSLADSFSWQLHRHSSTTGNYVQSGEWVTVHLEWADVSATTGAFSLSPTGKPSTTSGFTDVSFAAYDDKGGPVTYHLQALEALPDTGTRFPRGVVSITFDDSSSSVLDLAQPVMQAHGFTGTVYNIAEAVGTSGYLSVGQMRDLQDRFGWEMAGHAYALGAHNTGYSRLTSQQVEEDMGRLRAWLDTNRFTSPHFAYPHGAFQATSDGVPVDRIAAGHFATARTIISETIESLPPAMPYRLKGVSSLNDGVGTGGTPPTDVTGPRAKLDRCAGNGDWLILTFHQIVEGTPKSSAEISRTAFAAIMEAIAARGIPVLTVADAMSRNH